MNKRLLSVILFGFLFAGGASLVLYRVMLHQASASAAPPAGQLICVASRDVEPGKLLREEDIDLQSWPGPLPANVLRVKRDAVGRAVTSRIFKNEPVLGDRLAAAGAGAGLSALIPPGMRAVAVKVNDIVGLAGFVVPGTHVDVIASGSQSDVTAMSSGTVSRTILQDITVLSAGQDFKQESDGKPVSVQVVNLLVTPQQAEILSLAGNQTIIQLVLRNGQDKDKVQTTGVALNYLLASVAPAPVTAPVARQRIAVPRAEVGPPPSPAAPSASTNIEIFNGTKLTQVGVTPTAVPVTVTKEARP